MTSDSNSERAASWDSLKNTLRVMLEYACSSSQTTNVDQSQIDIAARLVLLDQPPGDKDWADAYKVVDYLTRIVGPATQEGIALEDEFRRHYADYSKFRISLGALVWRSMKDGVPYLQHYRIETMRFCILTLFLLIAAIYTHSKIIPAQNLIHAIDAQTVATLKLLEKSTILRQSIAAGEGGGAVEAAAIQPAGKAAAQSQLHLQIAALEGEQHDRNVDICFRHTYLKSWYLNYGLASFASWMPFNDVCAVVEDEVRAACNGEEVVVRCHRSGVQLRVPQAQRSAAAPDAAVTRTDVSTVQVASATLPTRLELTNEHIIRSHVDTLIKIWLPALYGALGACLWVIRERYAQIKEVRVSRARVVSRTSRMMLGAGTGSVVHMFEPLLPQGYEAVSLPALAFVVGYNVEFVFALADEFIKRFAGNQARA
ncbi:hypothetical protein [Desertibaculum subflavum]|uniref:hypothetical protein n=1 Tax=Desertibaculum subflavum TaxID=2268458 RepID=UPI000E6632F0